MTRVTQAEFARIAGVNRSTVHRWIQNGRIEADANGLIDPEAAARMREATESPMPHHQARKRQWAILRGMTKNEMAAYHAEIKARKRAINEQIKKGLAKIRKLQSELKEKNRRKSEKYKESARQYQRRISEKLTDSFVTKTLGKEFATPDLIELKRQQLAIRRLLKEFNAAIQPEKEISHAE